jgi:hypothetical protein
MAIPVSGTGPALAIPVGFRIREGGQPSRQVRASMQEIDDDHLLGVLDEEMPPGAGCRD